MQNAKTQYLLILFLEEKEEYILLKKHPEMFKELILDNTNEGDIVFDPCCGGGTTILACAASNRNFICCELNKVYYDKTIEMLKKEEIEINGNRC